MTSKNSRPQKTSKKSKLSGKQDTKNGRVEKIKLQIVYPTKGLASSDDHINVKVQATLDKEHCSHEDVLTQIGEKDNINIVMDNNVTATAAHKKGKKASYTAKIKTKYISEGLHKLQAVIPHKGSANTKKILDSEPVSFIVDRTRPFVRSLPSHNSVKEKEDGTSEIIIEAEDIHSDLDIEKCILTVDNSALGNPLKLENGLAFPLKSKLDEGKHQIRLVLFDMAGNKSEHISDFTIDMTPPVISPVSPSGIVKIDKTLISNIAAEAKNTHSGIDVNRRTVATDKMSYLKPSEKENDKFENYSEFVIEGESLISPIEIGFDERLQTEEKTDEYDETQSRKNLLNNLREKLIIDQQFLKKWLKKPYDTASEIGLSYTSEIERFLPPSPPEEYIDFSIKSDSKRVSKILDSLMTRVSASLREKTPSGLETLKKEGVFTKNGELTKNGKDFINAALQNPIGILENIGITLTDEERDAIFPPFPGKNAEELTRWISMVQLKELGD